LIGVAALACRRNAGAAASAEAPTTPLTILRRVTVCLAVMVSSRIVEFSFAVGLRPTRYSSSTVLNSAGEMISSNSQSSE